MVLQTFNKKLGKSKASSLYCVWVRNEREYGAPLTCIWINRRMRAFEQQLAPGDTGGDSVDEILKNAKRPSECGCEICGC
jgi:hypothetical protein